MRKLAIQGRGRISRNTSSLTHSPQKSGCHGLANSLAVRLFMNDSKVFGVNAQKQLRKTLPRKAHLDINNAAAIRHLTMRSVMQFAIGPQPKCRSTMRHFISAPIPGEPAANTGRWFRYALLFKESIDSYKRYRCSVLAARSVSAGGISKVIKNEPGVIRG